MTSPPPAAEIRLDRLSELTGMSPVLIRAWERRYSFPVPERTSGGHRRYSQAQADTLRRAAILVRSGLRAADAIARARADARPERAADIRGVARLSALLIASDAVEALDHLRGLWLSVGLDSTIEEFVMPALREIGDQWAAGRLTVDQEHIATGVVMSWLGAVRAELPSSDLGPPSYLIATPDGEEHGVAVWTLELLLRIRGVGSLALGVSLPSSDLIAAARRHRPAALVLAMSRRESKRAVAALARALALDQGWRPLIYVGGRGATSPLPADVVGLPETLTRTADHLASLAGA